MRYLLGIVLFALLLFSCRKKVTNELLEIPEAIYTIKGVLYDANGTTPVSDRRLVLSVRSNFSLTGYGDDVNYTQVVSTDQGGKFTFTYPTLDVRSKATLAISPHHDDLPALGDFLKDIPIHTNIERDICSCSFGTFDIIVSEKYIGMGDTLFVSHGFKDMDNGFSPIYTIQEIDKLRGLKREWNKSYQGQFLGAFWGIGRSGYEEALKASKNGETSEKGAQLQGTLRGFPHRDTLILE